ncbi:unnamed protein product, partial [marine sediment metagenome]
RPEAAESGEPEIGAGLMEGMPVISYQLSVISNQ